MADNQEAEASEESGKSGKKMIIMIILGAILVAGLAAGGTFFFLSGDSSDKEKDEPAAAETVKKVAIYTKIRTLEGKPSFVSSLQSDDGKRHYMQAYVEAKSRDQAVADALKLHMPLIVAKLNHLFGSQTFENLQSVEGKQKLRKDSTELVQGILQTKIGKPGIEAVLFTNFVMQ